MFDRSLKSMLAPVLASVLLMACPEGEDDNGGGDGDSGEETGDGDGDSDEETGDGDSDSDEETGDGDSDSGEETGNGESGEEGEEGEEGDSGEEGDGDPGDELSHAADIQPIWDKNCVTSCHEPGGLSAFMDLTDGFAALVNVASIQAPGVLRVDPGSSETSYLVAKLRGTQQDLGGSGVQMPAGKQPLDDMTIALIGEWINAGALP